MDTEYTRIGVAYTRRRGIRQNEYSIIRGPKIAYGIEIEPKLYACYAGYKEHQENGETILVGLPLGGPNWCPPLMMDFVPLDFVEIRFFNHA